MSQGFSQAAVVLVDLRGFVPNVRARRTCVFNLYIQTETI